MRYLRSKLSPLLFLSIIGGVVLCAAISSATLDTDVFFQKAKLFLAEGKYLEAVGLYQTVADTADNPEDKAQALLMIGAFYAFYLDRDDKAVNYFDHVFETYPQMAAAPEALFKKGVVLYKMRHYPEAHKVFNDYLTSYPDARHSRSATIWAESALNLAVSAAPGGALINPSYHYSPQALIRVLLAEQQKTAVVASPTGLMFPGMTVSGKDGTPVTRVAFSAVDGHLLMNGHVLGRSRCRVQASGQYLMLNGVRYRGSLDVAGDGNHLSVINYVPLEKYLYGVVPKEVPCDWPRQALMAQAIAARTYALSIRHRREDAPYDVVATTASQVYGGYNAEREQTTAAVDETCGQVMTYKGNLVIAYFHANSGGYTENPKAVWGAEVPYLKAHPDRYSVGAKGDSWRYFLPYAEAGQRLNDYGIHTSRVKRLQFQEKTPSGRFREVTVISDRGPQTINSNYFRLAVGSTKLKSTCFHPVFLKTGVLFEGHGYGHGVGMSQWGARQMAICGHDYKSILKHYYADINIASVVQ